MARSPARVGLRPNDDVVARVLGDGAVLVHLPSSRIFELNATGARVWQLIRSGISDADEITRRVTVGYDVAPEAAAREVRALLDRLVAEGLVEQ